MTDLLTDLKEQLVEYINNKLVAENDKEDKKVDREFLFDELVFGDDKYKSEKKI